MIEHSAGCVKVVMAVFALTISVSSHAWEQSVKCRGVGDPDPSAYPYESTITVGPGNDGRTVNFALSWKADSLRYIKGQGLELKIHQYNYDDAEATGKGPAYVVGPADVPMKFCNLPGCYIDSVYFSDKNSMDEYVEPQVEVEELCPRKVTISLGARCILLQLSLSRAAAATL
jgi:hypothetical protein